MRATVPLTIEGDELSFEASVRRFTRAYIDRSVRDMYPSLSFEIQGGTYVLRGPLGDGLDITRPGEDGNGGGATTNVGFLGIAPSPGESHTPQFADMVRSINMMADRFRDLPTGDGMGEVIGLADSVHRLLRDRVDAWSGAQGATPMASAIRLAEDGALLMEGAMIEAFKSQFLSRLDAMRQRFGGISGALGASARDEQRIWVTAIESRDRLMEALANAMEAAAAGGAGEVAKPDEIVGDTDGAWVGIGDALGILWPAPTVRPAGIASYPISTAREGATAINDLLWALAYEIGNAELAVRARLKAVLSLVNSESTSDRFDIRGSSEVAMTQAEAITIRPEDARRISAVALPALGATARAATGLLSGMSFSAITRNADIGPSTTGAGPEFMALNQALQALLGSFADDATDGARLLRLSIEDALHYERETKLELERLAADIKIHDQQSYYNR